MFFSLISSGKLLILFFPFIFHFYFKLFIKFFNVFLIFYSTMNQRHYIKGGVTVLLFIFCEFQNKSGLFNLEKSILKKVYPAVTYPLKFVYSIGDIKNVICPRWANGLLKPYFLIHFRSVFNYTIC